MKFLLSLQTEQRERGDREESVDGDGEDPQIRKQDERVKIVDGNGEDTQIRHEGSSEESDSETCIKVDSSPNRERWRNVPTKELHQRLAEVDQATAERLHPNNRRKIVRFDMSLSCRSNVGKNGTKYYFFTIKLITHKVFFKNVIY